MGQSPLFSGMGCSQHKAHCRCLVLPHVPGGCMKEAVLLMQRARAGAHESGRSAKSVLVFGVWVGVQTERQSDVTSVGCLV